MGFGGPFANDRSPDAPSPPFPPLGPPLSFANYVKQTDVMTKTVHALAIGVAATIIVLALYVGLAASYDYVAEIRRSRDVQQHKLALKAVREEDETDDDDEEMRR